MQMRKTKPLLYILHLLIFSILLTGCAHTPLKEMFYGSWDQSFSMYTDDLNALLETPMHGDVGLEVSLKATQHYHNNGTYSGEGEFIFRIKSANSDIPLRFFIKDTGKWSLHNNGSRLVETSSGGSLTPADTFTEQFLAFQPELTAIFGSFKPIKGEKNTANILSISSTEMEIQEEESKITLTMTRQ